MSGCPSIHCDLCTVGRDEELEDKRIHAFLITEHVEGPELEEGLSLTEYERRPDAPLIVAVRIDLETEGLFYEKWGGPQKAKRGDWLVSSEGSTYSIDAETFEATYTRVSQGLYRKTSHVWAALARRDGKLVTKEGTTRYNAGDWLVFNQADGGDGYAVDAHTFVSLYQPYQAPRCQ